MNTVDWLRRFKFKVIEKTKLVKSEYVEEEINRAYEEVLEEMINQEPQK